MKFLRRISMRQINWLESCRVNTTKKYTLKKSAFPMTRNYFLILIKIKVAI